MFYIEIKTLSYDSYRHFYQNRLQIERHSDKELKYQVFEQVIVSGYWTNRYIRIKFHF